MERYEEYRAWLGTSAGALETLRSGLAQQPPFQLFLGDVGVQRDLLAAVEVVSSAVLGQAALQDNVFVAREELAETRRRNSFLARRLRASREDNVELRARAAREVVQLQFVMGGRCDADHRAAAVESRLARLEAEAAGLRMALAEEQRLHALSQAEVGRLRLLYRDARVEVILQGAAEEADDLQAAGGRPSSPVVAVPARQADAAPPAGAPPVAVVAPVRPAGAAPQAAGAGPGLPRAAGPVVQAVPVADARLVLEAVVAGGAAGEAVRAAAARLLGLLE